MVEGAAGGRLWRTGHRHGHAAVQRRDHPELSRSGGRQRGSGPGGDSAHRSSRQARERWRCDRHTGGRGILSVYPASLPGCGRAAPRRPVRPGLRRGERLLPARAASWLAACRGDRAPSSRMSAGTRSAIPRSTLRRRNEALLERLHPGYADLVRAHAHADPLAESRRRLDLARWRAARRRGSRAVLLVTHASGGGVERQVAVSAAKYRDTRRPGDRAAAVPLARRHPVRQRRRGDGGRISQPALSHAGRAGRAAATAGRGAAAADRAAPSRSAIIRRFWS